MSDSSSSRMRSSTFLVAFGVLFATTLASVPQLRTFRAAKAVKAANPNILDAFLKDKNLQQLAEEHTKRLKPNLRHDDPVVSRNKKFPVPKCLLLSAAN